MNLHTFIKRYVQSVVWLPFHHSPICLERDPGLEPRTTESKSVELPLLQSRIFGAAYWYRTSLFGFSVQRFHLISLSGMNSGGNGGNRTHLRLLMREVHCHNATLPWPRDNQYYRLRLKQKVNIEFVRDNLVPSIGLEPITPTSSG